MTHPDVVYVVRSGERNEELRYSLRSLRNLPHGKVWIAGFMPSWVTGVGHIPTPNRPGGHVHAKANLRAACEHHEVSEEFVYFNDDFFVMQPMESLPVMHRGPLAEVVRSGVMSSAYTRSLDKTMQVLTTHGIENSLMYDLHAPMTVSKTGMLEALALCRHPHMHERTLYGNLNAIGGEKHRNYKVRRQARDWQTWPFISTNDHTFPTLPVGEYIRSLFKEGSPYEKDPTPLVSRGHPHGAGAPLGAGSPRSVRRPVRYSAASTPRRVRPVGVPA